MAKRKGVSLIVDEGFFNVFEKERQREQNSLRTKLGSSFNLTTKNFTALLAMKQFKFSVPKQKLIKQRLTKRRRFK